MAKVLAMGATTVIIPARNEELTIRKIVDTFQQHPATRGNVRVAIDSDTTDDTLQQVLEADGIPLSFRDTRGKGQLVRAAIDFLSPFNDFLSPFKGLTPRIVLCDGDYTGLTVDHITAILNPPHGVIIGVPDWPMCDVPDHVTTAWPHVSGFRCLPWHLVPPNAHGYLLETQINRAAVRDRIPVGHKIMHGLKAPFTWPLSDKRMEELIRDHEWGIAHGVF